MNKCKNCKHWKSNQRDLNYREDVGICLNDKMSFNTIDGRLVGVVDLEDQKDREKITGNPSNDFESQKLATDTIRHSNYLLVTNEEFGCNLFKKD